MDAFETAELVAAQDRPGEHTYVDFLRKEMLSLGMSSPRRRAARTRSSRTPRTRSTS